MIYSQLYVYCAFVSKRDPVAPGCVEDGNSLIIEVNMADVPVKRG
jgi:hypothetical protein